MKFFLCIITPGVTSFAFAPFVTTLNTCHKGKQIYGPVSSEWKNPLFWAPEGNTEENPSLEDEYFDQTTDFDSAVDAILDSMYRSSDTTIQKKAEEFEAELEDGYVQTVWLTRIISAWAKSKHDFKAPYHASFILDVMNQLCTEGYDYVRPNTITYNSVINAWVYSRDSQAPEKAQDLFNEMREKYKAGDKKLRPNAATYNMVIRSLASSHEYDKALKAEQILRDHWKGCKNGEVEKAPDTRSYDAVLSVYAKGNATKSSVKNVLRIIEEMWEINDTDPGAKIKPNWLTMTHLLAVLANQRDHTTEASMMADDIVKEMRQRLDEGDKDFTPNCRVYNTFLRVWLNNRDSSSTDRMFSILNEMEELYTKNNYRDIRPDLTTYRLILEKISYNRTEDAPEIAMGVLMDMWDKVQKGENDLRPTHEIYYPVLAALTRSNLRRDRTEKAYELFFDMIDKAGGNPKLLPTRNHFQLVLNGYKPRNRSHSVDAPDNIVAIIERMFKLYNEHGLKRLNPNSEIFGEAIAILIRHGSPNEASIKAAERLLQVAWDNIQPPKPPLVDSIHYLNLMTAWTRLKNENSVDHTEALYNDLCQRYKSTGFETIRPNLYIFNAMMTAYARSKRQNSVEKTREIMSNMQQLNITPDLISYNSLLNAMSKSNEASDAEALLDEMLKDQKNPIKSFPKPNIVSFSTVINALSYLNTNEAAVRAQELLTESWKMFETGDETMKPNSFTYTPVITAWCSVGEPSKANAILNQMMEKDLTPNTYHYNYIITAYTKEGTVEAAKRAEDLFQDQWNRLSSPPDVVAFQAVLAAWVNCEQPDKAQSFFMEMIETGYIPTSMVYNVIVEGLVAVKGIEGLYQAERFINFMWDRFESYPRARPNLINYTKLISAFTKISTKSADGFYTAQRMLKKLWKKSKQYPALAPDVITYTVILQTASYHLKGEELYRRSKEILMDVKYREMAINRNFYGVYLYCLTKSRKAKSEELSDILEEVEVSQEGVNTFILNIILQEYAKRDIIRARAFLEEMWIKYDESKESHRKPDISSYVFLMSAYQKEKSASARASIQELAEDVERRYKEGDNDFVPTYEFKQFAEGNTEEKFEDKTPLTNAVTSYLEEDKEYLEEDEEYLEEDIALSRLFEDGLF